MSYGTPNQTQCSSVICMAAYAATITTTIFRLSLLVKIALSASNKGNFGSDTPGCVAMCSIEPDVTVIDRDQ